MTPYHITDAYGVDVCNRCGCLWQMEAGANPHADWCERSDCRCHSEWFADAYIAEKARVAAEIDR